jgi:hypothetical protein
MSAKLFSNSAGVDISGVLRMIAYSKFLSFFSLNLSGQALKEKSNKPALPTRQAGCRQTGKFKDNLIALRRLPHCCLFFNGLDETSCSLDQRFHLL